MLYHLPVVKKFAATFGNAVALISTMLLLNGCPAVNSPGTQASVGLPFTQVTSDSEPTPTPAPGLARAPQNPSDDKKNSDSRDGGVIQSPGQSGSEGGNYIAAPAQLIVSPMAFNFQVQSVQSYTSAVLTLKNVGERYATDIQGVGLQDPYSFAGGQYPGTGGTCGLTLAPKDTCTVVITFHPTAVGKFPFNGLQFNYFGGSALNVELNGGGTDIATLHISNEVDNNSFFDYGTIAYGSQVVHKFMVQYWGAKPATGVSFAGISGPYQILWNNCPSQISASCELAIQYSGNSAGSTQETLKLFYNNSAYAAEADHIVSGKTTAQVLPANLTISNGNFGRILQGTSQLVTLNVRNSGTQPATNVSASTFSNPVFTFNGGSYPGAGGNCGSTITSSCSLVVRFSPPLAGSYSDQVQLNYSNASGAQTATGSISGDAAGPAQVTVSPVGSSDFGSISVNYSSDKNFVISNSGSGVLATGIVISGLTSPYTLIKDCSDPIQPGQSCTATVRFHPTQVGQASGSFTLSYFNGSQTDTVTQPVSGTGDAGVLLQFTQSNYNFGSVVVGAQTTLDININYYGVLSGGHCIFTGLSTTTSGVGTGGSGDGNPFSFEGGSYPGTSGTCLQQINSPCKIRITFFPQAVGTYTTTFTITYDNGEGQTLTTKATLTGTAVGSTPASLTLSPYTSTDFGNDVVNSYVIRYFALKRTGDLSATQVSGEPLPAPFKYVGGNFPGYGGNCGSVMSGSLCWIAVIYQPTSAGSYGPVPLVVDYNNGISMQKVSINMTGSAYNAAYLSVNQPNFGKIPLNQSGSGQITFQNIGTQDASAMSLGSLPTGSPFTIQSSDCASSLPVGASCSVQVSFSSAIPGQKNATLSLAYQNGVGSAVASANLTAKAVVPVLVSANGESTCSRLEDGTVKCWGENNYGQLGLGDTNNRGDSNASGHQMGSSLPVVNLGSGRWAKAISVGYFHACAILDDNSVKCWGENNYGQLGQGNSVSSIGSGPNEMGDNLPAIQLGSNAQAVSISAGYAHTCVLLSNGTVKCWGYNGEGQLGLGDTNTRGLAAEDMGDNLPAIDLGGMKAVQIAASTGHTCALLENDSIKCWGNNFYGELGIDDFMNRGNEPDSMGIDLPAVNLGTGRTAVQMAAGGAFNCAVMDNGQVKCWGRNEDGILGMLWCQDPTGAVGSCSNSAFPLPLNGYGITAGEMGDNLPAVNLGTNRKVVSLSAANSHTCALLDNGALKCWGNSDYGQLGQGSTTALGTDPSQMGDALGSIALGSGAVIQNFSAGNYHTCVTLTSGQIKCWGGNRFGGLGLGDTNNRGDAPGEMGDNLPAVAF